jgi:uncharacterized small protein (DUF1192 family)
MNVKQALKLKNKLVGEIKEQYEIAKKYNSIEEGNPRRYQIEGALQRSATLTKELVELKTKLHKANMPVYHLIFELAEAKGRIKELKKIPTDEGKQESRYGSVISVKEVELSVVEIAGKIRSMEETIERLQNELDIHNSNTEI